MQKKVAFFLVFFIKFALFVTAQSSITDSLNLIVSTLPEGANKMNVLYTLGKQYKINDPQKAMKCYKEALVIAEKIASKKTEAAILQSIGGLHKNNGNYPVALQYLFKALKIREEIKDPLATANSLNTIGLIYYGQGDLEGAQSYYLRVLKIGQETGDSITIAMAYANLGSVYKEKGDEIEALNLNFKALKLWETLNDTGEIAGRLNNIGLIYVDQKKYEKALDYLFQSLKYSQSIKDDATSAETYVNIGFVYEMQGKYKESVVYRNKGVKIGKKLNYSYILKGAYAGLITSYINLKDTKAEKYFELYTAITDSIYTNESAKQIAEMQTKYGTEKKEQEIQLQSLTIGKKEAELKKQKTFIYLGLAVLVLVISLAFFIYNGYRQKKKANVQLAIQNSEIQHQKALVEEKNKDITDSINYAKRIQDAILPTIKSLNDTLKNGFVLYIPKDIVAGDFYWMETYNNKVYFAAADCTGHGVPGAMVSVICSNALSKALLEEGIEETGKLLDRTRELVIDRFAKSDNEVRDGMDISLCAINLDTKKMQWSGANNPLWLIRNNTNEIREIKPDKQPIGKYAEEKPFSTHDLQLQHGDTIYIFTDGYADQFGGPKGKKFKYKQLNELLSANCLLSMEEQREKLKTAFEGWKGVLEQVDDVCMIGLKV